MWFILRWLLLLLVLLAVKTHQANDQEVPFTDDELALSSLSFGNETLWNSGIFDGDNSTLNASSYNTADYEPEAETPEQNRSSSHTQRLQKAQSALQLQVLEQQPSSSSNQSQDPQLPLPTYPPSVNLCAPLVPPQVPPHLLVPEHHSPTLWRLEVPQQRRSPLQRLGMAQVSPEPHSRPQQQWVPEQPGLSHQPLDVVQMHGSPLQQLQFAEVLQRPRTQLQQPGSPVQQLQASHMPQEQGSHLHRPQVPQQPSSLLQWQQVAQVPSSRPQQRQVVHMPQEQGSQLHRLQVPQQPSSPLQWQQVAQVPSSPPQHLQVVRWPQRPLYQLLMPHYPAKYSHYPSLISRYRRKMPLFRTKHYHHPQRIRYPP